ncbi:MAG: cobalamin biosynthesis protein, partial [Clostridia bacterium]
FGFLYKAINTLDSMIGYKNEKYRFFGTVGAKLDDFANYLPSRISAIMMIFACKFVKLDCANAFKIWKRDKRCHESPNSAQTESVVAGALKVQLAGDAIYGGVCKKKPTIGDLLKEIEIEDIRKTNKLMYATAILSLVIFCGIKALILLLV